MKKALIFIVLSIAVYHPFSLRAHEITNEPWIYINETALTEENNSEKPSKLIWPTHLLENNFLPNETINIEVKEQVIMDSFSTSKISVEWESVLASEMYPSKEITQLSSSLIEIKDYNSYAFQGNTITIKYGLTGSFEINARVLDENSREIIEESFEIKVGEAIQKSEIQIEGGSNIKRSEAVKFSVVNPDINKYEYQWDLLDGYLVSGNEVSKQFINTRLPAYVVLRTVDKTTKIYADSYVRIDSEEPPQYKAFMPPVVKDENAVSPVKADNTMLMIFGTLIVIGVSGLIILAIYLKSGKIHGLGSGKVG